MWYNVQLHVTFACMSEESDTISVAAACGTSETKACTEKKPQFSADEQRIIQVWGFFYDDLSLTSNHIAVYYGRN